MRKPLFLACVAAAACALTATRAEPACCYFSAMDRDVTQPGQRAFITWDPVEKVESFTVQPQFEGNAEEFGMVVPTPSQPKLAEVHRDLFKTLAVFTILRPVDWKKWAPMPKLRGGAVPLGGYGGAAPSAARKAESVRVLEAGTVGTLDYKIIEATNAQGLYEWLKDNKYAYSGDEATLDHYIAKKWFFTVMKIDPKQMKRRPDGTYLGEVTPTRFTFTSDRLVYPLRITKISVKDRTDALFYVQAPEKMDLPGALTWQTNHQTLWWTAYNTAVWEHHGAAERQWWDHVKDRRDDIFREYKDVLRRGRPLTTLEWARRITDDDLAMAAGEAKFDREAPPEDVKKLATLAGILRKGQFVTKCRHVFHKDEMDEDLVFVEASYKGRKDGLEYVEAMPSSPP